MTSPTFKPAPTTPIMPRFSDIPLDLLPYILEYLSKREYNSLVRVCTSLHREVLPYLYHDITFKAGKSRGCARKLAFLLRTLLERPQLASHVTAFRLLGSHPCWTKYNPWPEDRDTWTMNLWGLEGCTTLSKAQMILASNRFYQLVDEEIHKSLAQYRGRSKDALAILALTRFTQLTTLEIGDGFLMYSLFLPQILKRGGCLFPTLENVILGDRALDSDNTVIYTDLDLIRPVFYLPTVKTFEWTMSQPWRFEWKRQEAPRSESLTMLHLFRANINRATLSQLLSATPNLKRFHYEHEVLVNRFPLQTPPIDLFLNLHGLNNALSNVTNTLEECKLTLNLAPGSTSQNKILEKGLEFPAIQGTLTVLRGMKNLRKVEVPMVMFLGWFPNFAARFEEVLPPQITDLTLRDDFVIFCPWAVGFDCNRKVGLIGDYIEERNTHAPTLDTFKIQLTSAKNDYWLLDAVKDLKAPISGRDVLHWISHESKTETHCWRFGGSASRKDSVIPGMFPST